MILGMALLGLVSLLAFASTQSVVYAAAITVTSTTVTIGNDWACTLRVAIINANNDDQSGSKDRPAGNGADTVILPMGTFVLSIAGIGENAARTGDLDIHAGSSRWQWVVNRFQPKSCFA